jgi:hypothetical protein
MSRNAWILMAASLTFAPGCCAAQSVADCLAKNTTPAPVVVTDGARQIAQKLSAGKKDEALAQAKQMAAEYPQSAVVQVALGAMYYQSNDVPPMIAAFNRAAQLDPCNSKVHFYAWRLDALGAKQDAAVKQLDLARQLSPDDEQIQRTWQRVQTALALEAAPGAPLVKMVNPPFENFYAKRLDCDGIAVRSSAAVDSMALVLACGKVRAMLEHLPAARKSIHSHGGELHLIADRQGTTDLPENLRFKTQEYTDAEGRATNMDARTRGVGGLMTSCGEENLLGLPGDRYRLGEDICTHEFAHEIMNVGLTDRQRSEIVKRYHEVLAKGLWKGAYAAVNPQEYWADISMWYFGSHGQYVPGGITTPGPQALQAYDPDSFALVQGIYSGKM